MKARWQFLVVGFSLANICLYHQWATLELHTSSLLYRYENASPYPQTYLAMLINLVGMGLLLAGVAFLTQTSKKKWVRGLCFAIIAGFFVLGLNSFRQVLRGMVGIPWLSLNFFVHAPIWLNVLVLLGSVGLGFLIFRKRKLAFPFLFGFLTFISPLALFHAGWSVRNLFHDNYGDTALAAPIKQNTENKTRVVWVIFDTMEQRSTFTARPAGLELPELDALKNQSVYGTNVYSPGVRTHYSLGSYLTGKIVRLAYPAHGTDSRLFFKDDDKEYLFGKVPSLFDKARAMGYRTGLVGWYHPYCRMMSHSLDQCVYHSVNERLADHPTPDLGKSIKIHLSKVFPRRKIVPAVEGYQFLSDAAVKMVADPSLGLVFLHMPVPHPPWVYDRKTGEIKDVDTDFRDEEGFWGNLALADITLGRLRVALQEAGLWDSTTLLVSSDHWWWFGSPENQVYRPDGALDFRIPFLLKMAGQKENKTYKAPFNAVSAHELLLKVLQGEVNSPKEVASWLDKNKGKFALDPVMETNIYGWNL